MDTKQKDVYALPREITDIKECYFYHTMDIPGHGIVKGEWDLRDSVNEYLGNVQFSGKRVLEVGTASGFLCFYMESQGAEVVAYDLSDKHSWDIVPFPDYDYDGFKAHINRLNNGYWFTHKAFQSKAKVVYGAVYTIPEEIGEVDIATFSSILLHVRDPFLALEKALKLTTETVIITELLPPWEGLKGPAMRFLPDPRTNAPKESWWTFTPDILIRFIRVLGFKQVEVKYHTQKYNEKDTELYTIIGRR